MSHSDYTWDPRKARANVRKHGVTFGEGLTVFDDGEAYTVFDEAHSQTEDRYATVGRSASGSILYVGHTAPNGGPGRIITVRFASRRERQEYDDG